MRATAETLARFYATADGQRAARTIAEVVRPRLALRPNARLLALGWPMPILDSADRDRVERLVMAMPSTQGAAAWPVEGASATVLVHSTAMPFTEALFDQVILVHAIEFANKPDRLLRELWRVLAPAGELLLVVANRASLWVNIETTPFGEGRPFSRGQLTTLLADAMFEPADWRTTLAAPPLRGLRTLDKLLLDLFPRMGGVHIVKAVKADGIRPLMAGRATTTTPAYAVRVSTNTACSARQFAPGGAMRRPRER